MLSSDFHCKEKDWFRDVSIHPRLSTSGYGVHEVEVTVASSMSCVFWMYGYDLEPVIFLQ